MKLDLISDKDEPEAGQIFVDVGFDGHIQKCFLDTGATSTKVITNSFFSSYNSVKSAQVGGLSGKGVSADRVQIAKISIGTYSLGEHEIIRLPEGLPMTHTAGIDLLKNQHVTFDFKTRDLNFKNQEAGLPFNKSKAGHILIPVTFNTLNVKTIWDTGAGLTTIDQKIIDAHPGIFRYLKTLEVGDTVSEKGMQLKLYEVDSLKVGPLLLQKVKILGADFSFIAKKVGDPDLGGALGYNVLTHYKWYFDMATQKYSVQQ